MDDAITRNRFSRSPSLRGNPASSKDSAPHGPPPLPTMDNVPRVSNLEDHEAICSRCRTRWWGRGQSAPTETVGSGEPNAPWRDEWWVRDLRDRVWVNAADRFARGLRGPSQRTEPGNRCRGGTNRPAQKPTIDHTGNGTRTRLGRRARWPV